MPPSAQASTGKTDTKTAKTVIFLKTTDRPVKEIARDAGYRDALVHSFQSILRSFFGLLGRLLPSIDKSGDRRQKRPKSSDLDL